MLISMQLCIEINLACGCADGYAERRNSLPKMSDLTANIQAAAAEGQLLASSAKNLLALLAKRFVSDRRGFDPRTR